MAGLMDRLLDILKQQITNYDRLIVLSEEKKDIIIKNEAERLQKITSEENSLVGNVRKLDKNRLTLMKEIGIVLNISNKEYTLNDLVKLMENQPEYDTLSSLASDTKERLINLKTLNDRNKVLLENSLEYIDFSVNVLRSGARAEKIFYDSSGEEIGQGAGFFDARQ